MVGLDTDRPVSRPLHPQDRKKASWKYRTTPPTTTTTTLLLLLYSACRHPIHTATGCTRCPSIIGADVGGCGCWCKVRLPRGGGWLPRGGGCCCLCRRRPCVVATCRRRYSLILRFPDSTMYPASVRSFLLPSAEVLRFDNEVVRGTSAKPALDDSGRVLRGTLPSGPNALSQPLMLAVPCAARRKAPRPSAKVSDAEAHAPSAKRRKMPNLPRGPSAKCRTPKLVCQGPSPVSSAEARAVPRTKCRPAALTETLLPPNEGPSDPANSSFPVPAASPRQLAYPGDERVRQMLNLRVAAAAAVAHMLLLRQLLRLLRLFFLLLDDRKDRPRPRSGRENAAVGGSSVFTTLALAM
jgi:hypothetical protein